MTSHPNGPYTGIEVTVSDNEETISESVAPKAAPSPGIRSHWLLIAAVAAAAGAAFFGKGSPAPSSEAPAAAAPVATSEGTVKGAAQDDASTISGKVLERIDVEKYTYLRLDAGPRGGETWVAVTTATTKVGDSVRVVNAELMTNFVSASLKRTFERIYFGALDDGARAAAPKAGVSPLAALAGDPHAGVPGAPPLGAAALPAAAANPHAAPSRAGDDVPVTGVEKAPGSNGRTVAEVHAQASALTGQAVRVRGVVVKSVSGVLGRTFVHVRDGSGSADAKNNDLSATTLEKLAVGDRVLLEGKIATAKDFGMGYTYPVLLEDAKRVSE